MKNKHISGWQY